MCSLVQRLAGAAGYLICSEVMLRCQQLVDLGLAPRSIYVYVYVYICVCVYINKRGRAKGREIEREKEREIEREKDGNWGRVCVCVCVSRAVGCRQQHNRT